MFQNQYFFPNLILGLFPLGFIEKSAEKLQNKIMIVSVCNACL